MSDWKVVPLRDVADIRVSNVDKKTLLSELPVRLCNYMDVYSNDYIRPDLPFMEATATAAEIQRFRVAKGDVLITKDSETPDDIGIPAAVTDEIDNLVCGYHLAQIRPIQSVVEPVYLSKQLSLAASAIYFAQRATGSTRYGLSNRTLAETPIRLAPLQQQKRIAAILTGLDNAIGATEALIEKHQQIKAGLMHDLFTRGMLPDGSLRPSITEDPFRFERTEVGDVPRDWRVFRLSECVEVVDPNPSHRYPPPTVDGIPIASTENFVGEDGIDLSHASRVPLSTFREQNVRCRFSRTDVVFARKGQIGLARRYGDEPKVFSHTVVLLKPLGGRCHASWLLWAARSSWVLKYIDRTMNSNSGVPTLGVAFIKDVPLPFPPFGEQELIASRLDAASETIGALEGSLQKLRYQKLGLMQDLLTGRVLVKLADATLEPALA
ncbi:restriction endonuclease subunit S [Piscinibacter koreensis]|uniref:Restriction endonuclease subunit S n=1 Tax=Piscinibacter koreensis TaxID=2742824 RepID=A0A7Y6TY20_9BURK|nr:restriction endonuclease subunit S [Schlegelella koreensis]NUZ07667.1 restriction endonuclease subunit S [Schlegelella koreensis]